MGGKRLTQEEVEKIFLDQGCSFDDVYINTSTPHSYTCECGNKSKIKVEKFKIGQRCVVCKVDKIKKSLKLSYESVYNYFKDEGCELLETEYINAHTKMNYRCSCGNESLITFNNFQQGKSCSKCGGTEKLTYDFVYKTFKDEGCELLETEYINSKTLMKYKCNCGGISSISFNNFNSDQRCRECGIVKRTGENSTSWNPNREEIPLNLRLRTPHPKDWISKHMKDDPNYNEFLLNPTDYVLDHIIPVSLFCQLYTKYILDETELRKIINKRDNLQLLTWKENSEKGTKGSSLFEAANFLINNGIPLIKFLEENERI